MDDNRSQPDNEKSAIPSVPVPIPGRFEILELTQLMGRFAPVIMLGNNHGYGTRWTLHGHEVQPGIARYLMEQGYLAESGSTEFGARMLALTDAGMCFRDAGIAWWNSLDVFEKLKVRVFG